MLTKKQLISLEALIYIASHPQAKAIRSNDICTHLGLSDRYLERILQTFTQHGILRSIKGPKGGYSLAKERRRISLGEVCQLIAETEDTVVEMAMLPLSATILQLHTDLSQKLITFLDTVSLEDLVDQDNKQIKIDTTNFNI